jgi:transposase
VRHNGVPLNAVVTPGQAHECRHVARLPGGVRVGRRSRPDAVTGDAGYSDRGVRQHPERRQIEPVIPTRSDQPRDEAFDPRRYRGRNAAGRCVGWLKQRRRVATGYEKRSSR